MAPADEAVARAADRLERAAQTREPCPPVRDLIGAEDVDRAYAVQAELTRRRKRAGARRVGWKIGLTNPAVQAQLGVDQPDFGVLFDGMRVSGELDRDMLVAPRVEAEVAVVLSADLDDRAAIDDRARLCAAVGSVVPALEVVDSRIANWDISIVDTVADNASSGAFVTGRPNPLGAADLRQVRMTLRQDGEVVSAGSGRDCLGDPLAALAWLAGVTLRLGEPLRTGDLVLTGALGPMVPVQHGAHFEADLGWLGTVSLAVGAAEGGGDR
ncbi:fumarylacetoacetate hydrolase family protein [Phytoactinopolyspora endophytica]|uniref:2-keto-4-pentenoate hydratase n=1 Tax=Phytoactinopolyspora endophytica TaxID=1642495 RepID=UPI00101D8A0F